MRFTKTPDGSILDAATGLEWELASRGPMAWQEAVDSCAALGDGWRLPTSRELLTLVDYDAHNPAIVDPLRASTRSDGHWSSTTVQAYPYSAWIVFFYDGYTDYNNKTGSYFVRAVRSGSRPFDDSTADVSAANAGRWVPRNELDPRTLRISSSAPLTRDDAEAMLVAALDALRGRMGR